MGQALSKGLCVCWNDGSLCWSKALPEGLWGIGAIVVRDSVLQLLLLVSSRLSLPRAQLCSHGPDRDPTAEAGGPRAATCPQQRSTSCTLRRWTSECIREPQGGP